jgi:hypothetical protein
LNSTVVGNQPTNDGTSYLGHLEPLLQGSRLRRWAQRHLCHYEATHGGPDRWYSEKEPSHSSLRFWPATLSRPGLGFAKSLNPA